MASILLALRQLALCSCPAPAALADITKVSCPEDAGQIQKAYFQRRYSTGTTLNGFVIATADPTLAATWTTATTAVDGTKVVTSPYIQNPETDGGGAITYGGGNTTLGGTVEVVNSEPVTFTSNMLKMNQLTIVDMKALACEELTVFLIDQYGRIWGTVDDLTTPTIFRGIPLRSFHVSDKLWGGLEAPDYNNLTWSFEPNYSDKLAVQIPADFNALTDF